MSIQTVLLTPADEKFSPPETVIEVCVVQDGATEAVTTTENDTKQWWELRYPRQLVMLSHSTYEETSDSSTLKRTTKFPAIDVNDLLRALASFGVAVQSLHVGAPPTRLPAPSQEQP
jgi:kynurenine formamidase